MLKIYQILEHILGPSKTGFSSDIFQYQFECPLCGENLGKYNLELNLQIQRFKCWKCCDTDGTQGGITKLIKLYGNSQLLQEYNEEIKNIREHQLYDFNYLNKGVITKIDVVLPESFRKIKSLDNIPYKLKKYLISRKIDQKLIDKFNIGYTDWSDPVTNYRARVIFPSYDFDNKLNYWVGRDYTNNNKRLKYINSKADKTEIVFWENLINWDADIYLVEGIFDALPLNNAIPMLGKFLKRDSYLFKTLLKRANGNIIIILDQDTEIDETKKIYKVLNSGRLKNKIKYCPLFLDKDISDIYVKYGVKGIISTLQNTNYFKEIDLI